MALRVVSVQRGVMKSGKFQPAKTKGKRQSARKQNPIGLGKWIKAAKVRIRKAGRRTLLDVLR